ncbi:MAG TPA: hypothetical protein VN748_12110 [Pseudonocardiaceae bacterium]|nr:hypothetical protein [Pseudonocardiaceae bacterium]
MLSERKPLPEAQFPLQIEDPDLGRSLEAVEPHPPRDHHRWAFPVGVILAAVLTVPGPSALPAAEITARSRPPRPRIRRNAAPFPVGRSSPRSRSASGHRQAA